MALLGGVPTGGILNFAITPNSWLFMSSGLNAVTKWDGLNQNAQNVGVPAPTTAPVIAARSENGGISGTYTCFQRWLDNEDRPSNLSPISNSLIVSGRLGFNYSGVQAPTDAKVVKRQILRNTSGQALTYYVAHETTDLTSTVFNNADILTDAQLQTKAAFALFDSDGRSNAVRFGVPPNDKPFIATFQDRMFLAGDAPYVEGHAIVINGSTQVTGIGTNWTTAMVNRVFLVTGDFTQFTISAVNAVSQILTLSAVYSGASNKFAAYQIRSTNTNRRTIQWSGAGLYEAYSPFDALTIEDNGDEVTGLIPGIAFLLIIQRRNTYRLSYQTRPEKDGGIFLYARRGCLNNRVWVYVGDELFIMDETGIYRLSAAGEEAISAAIQDLFWWDQAQGLLRINWSAKKYFHAVLNREDTTIRWFISLNGQRFPRHALCYHYISKDWWLEEFPFPVPCSTLDTTSSARMLIGGSAARIFHAGVGRLDVINASSGSTRGTVTTGKTTQLIDNSAGGDKTFPTSGMVGAPIAIVGGRGKGQVNLITAVSGGTITFKFPWRIKPDTTSLYQIGGIGWKWKSHRFRWIDEETDQQRRITVQYPPTLNPATFDLRIFKEQNTQPDKWALTWPDSAEADGVSFTKDDPDAVIDLTKESGFAQLRIPGHRERYIQRADRVYLEMRGFSSKDPIQISEIAIEGAR